MRDIAMNYNELIDAQARVTKELGRLAKIIGREGRMTERAVVPAASGEWAAALESVNDLIDDLVRPTTEIARVMDAVADGDLTQKMQLKIAGQPVKGEFLRIGTTVNEMVDQLSSFADEVTRVAREVGTDGKLGGQATVKGVSGTWRDLTDSVNFMATNLTDQVRNIATVTTAVANGDLSQKITVDARGEILQLKNTINTMVDQLSSFADEVTRVAREVGTEGKLGGQAEVKGVSGTWRDLTENVNLMANNLTDQVRNVVAVTTAIANGDLSQKITVEAKGEVAALADTINSMTDTLQTFAEQVTTVAREVGTEGKLGGQADVPGVAGTWRDLTDNVNLMANNLTDQVRNVAAVTTAIANGDLTQEITVEAKGEVAALADTINTMVNRLSSFAEQVTRVAREVGTEGKLGGQAEVEGVAGTWKDLTDNVNLMANNLTSQVRSIAGVTTAVANGDLTQEITVEAKGEVAALADTINTMVDQLSSFADEVTRVAREVGTEGKLGGQAEVKGVSGTWRDLTDNVNLMANNLTDQVRNVAAVTTAIANGDLSQKITVEAKGEVAALAETINTMVDQLRSFAAEVTRVAREVGTDGKLGGQAEVEDVSGTWRDLTESVNFMASNLTDQVRNVVAVTTAIAEGDLTQKITVEAKGEVAALAETINSMTDTLQRFAAEVTRVAREVGTEGKLGGQAEVEGVSGTWRGLTENVNLMADNLTDQVRNIATVTTAVANGDLSQKITVDARGEILELKNTINTMVDQLSSFADEVTRVASEVGTDGKLGGQAEVEGVSGTWRGLTENVNLMADNLTDQVRNIATVATAVANGDLSQKITVDARGEILQLKNTINTMVDQLSSFADEVTRVAREVGTEGELGGQAEVEGVSGTWRGLTENVNQLASNLTTQVRAIREVASSVTQGDLTRSIDVEAQGEVAELKDNINQMIANLRETTEANEQQDWLKTNLARISGLMQGQRDLRTVSRMIMSELTPSVSAQLGAFYMTESVENGDEPTLRLIASYGYKKRKNLSNEFKLGEGLVGQAALEKIPITVKNAPDDYVKIASGLGEGDAGQHHRPPGAVRGPGARRDRARVVRAVQRDPPDVPRAADGDDRRRAEHPDREHAHRGAAAAVAVAHAGAPEPVRGAPVAPGGAEAVERGARGTGAVAQGVRGAAPAAAGGAPADERGAPGEGRAARAAEPRHRDQEPRDRARARGPRGARGAAGAELEVQVGVPREHVARAPHAAQQPADPLEHARREPGGQPRREAGRVREDDQHGGQRPARADQRHPRPVEGRGGQDGRARVAARAAGVVCEYVEQTFHPVAADKGLDFEVAIERRRAARDRHRRAAAPAGPSQPALERVQVHRQGPRRAARRPRPGPTSCSRTTTSPAPRSIAFAVIRHRASGSTRTSSG